jgi:hypothetical protein
VVTPVVIALVVGCAVGIWVGINLAVGTGFVDRLVTQVGHQILNEHRAYRLVLAKHVGSTAEAERLMAVYRETECL